jgi:predicted phage-related endonuclease
MKSQIREVTTLNPLKEYIAIKNQIEYLEKQKSKFRDEIYAQMDEFGSDFLMWDGMKAERKLIVTVRIDAKKAKEVLGDAIKDIQSESSQVRLAVI